MSNTFADTLTSAISALPQTGLEDLDNVQLMRRFDTKFVVPEIWLPGLVEALAPHSHVLSVAGEIECRYDNLYFELPGDKFLIDHLKGKARRMKIRKRRYASNDKTFLEVKKRLPGRRTFKERMETSNGMAPNFNAEEQAFLGARLRKADQLIPQLTGGFKRTTFIDFERNERVTVDRNLDAGLVGEHTAPLLKGMAIIELKQPRPDRYSPIQFWLRSLEQRKGIIGRKTSMSKYAVARLSRDNSIAGRAYISTYRRLMDAQSWIGGKQV